MESVFQVLRLRLSLPGLWNEALERAGILEGLLHAGPTDAGGFFIGCCCAVPVSFKAHGFAIADLAQGAELGSPVDKPRADRRPLDFAACILDGILYVAVMNAILGKSLP